MTQVRRSVSGLATIAILPRVIGYAPFRVQPMATWAMKCTGRPARSGRNMYTGTEKTMSAAWYGILNSLIFYPTDHDNIEKTLVDKALMG
jgi:hypothetical protein